MLELDLGVHDVLDVVVVDGVEHLLEDRVALALPGDERVLLAHGPQVDALPQVVHLREVLTPLLVDDLQHDVALDLAHESRFDGLELLLALLVVGDRLGQQALVDVVGPSAWRSSSAVNLVG